MKYIAILSLLILSGCATSFPLYAEDINWYRVTSNAAIALDWAQTRSIIKDDGFHENNLFLGERPSARSVNKHFIGSLFLNNLIGSYLLPKKQQNDFYLITSTVNIINVSNNYRVGIRINF